MRRYILQAGFLFALALVCNLATKIASSQTEVASQPEHSTAETRPDGATRLTNPPTGASDQNPAFSPDGKQLVLTRFETGYNAGPAGLFLLNLQNGIITRLTPWEDQDNVNLPGSAWNPANNRIVFASDRLEADDLWRIAPDGSDFTRVLTYTGLPSDIEPSWSPDGEWIVYSTDYGRLHTPNIFVIPSAGGKPIPITTSATHEDGAPSWCPDGTWIAFESHLGQDEDTPSSLWAQTVPAGIMNELKANLPLTVTEIN